MTTEVELCKQMIGDGIAHGIIVKVGVILVLSEWIFLNEKFLHPPDVGFCLGSHKSDDN